MEEKINLVDIFKYVKEGTKFYSSTHGYVNFHAVLDADCVDYPLLFKSDFNNDTLSLDKYGCHLKGVGECIIFPSKENRDWSTFKPEYPIDTPMMVTNTEFDGWKLRYYAGNNKCFPLGLKSRHGSACRFWEYIIPASEFDFNNPEKYIK